VPVAQTTRATRELLALFLELTRAEQLAAFKERRELVAGEISSDSDAVAEARARTLEMMGIVAAELGLPAGKAPTVREFNATARKLGLDWTANRATQAFGRWLFAQDAYLGERAAVTPKQRALQSAAHKRGRLSELDHLATSLASSRRTRRARHSPTTPNGGALTIGL
jgi:hypothetical protein